MNKTDEFGNIEYDTGKPLPDEEGRVSGDDGWVPTYEPKQEIKYRPCYYEDYTVWSGKDIAELYYKTGEDGGGNPIYSKTTSTLYQ